MSASIRGRSIIVDWGVAETPVWNKNGGIWYSIPAMDPNARLTRWRPNLHTLCAKTIDANLPEDQKKRFEIYREGLEVVRVFQDACDLLILAMYRQYVSTETNIDLDFLFYEVALDIGLLFPANSNELPSPLSLTQWKHLSERMPEGSWIKSMCVRQSIVVVK